MKFKTMTLVAVAVMMVSMFAATAMAANMDQDRDRLNDGSCGTCIYADTDGDGVCDNFVDEDGDGICDNCLATGDCDGNQDRDRIGARNGSCRN